VDELFAKSGRANGQDLRAKLLVLFLPFLSGKMVEDQMKRAHHKMANSASSQLPLRAEDDPMEGMEHSEAHYFNR
jgi:hypothetical protein